MSTRDNPIQFSKILPSTLVAVVALSFLPSFARAVPLDLEPDTEISVELALNAEVDGAMKKFILDTGSQDTSVESDEQSSRWPLVKSVKNLSSGAKNVRCDVVKIPTFALDSLSMQNAHVDRCRHMILKNSIGLGTLDRHIWSLSFSNREFNLLEGDPYSARMHQLHRGPSDHLRLPVQVGNIQTVGIFDTGWSITAVDKRLIRERPDLFELTESREDLRDAFGNRIHVKYYHLKELQIGELLIRDETVMAYDFPPPVQDMLGGGVHVFIGTNSMMRADWILDLKHDLWAVNPHEPSREPAAEMQWQADSEVSGRIGVNAYVDGVKKYFDFDTGSPVTFLAPDKQTMKFKSFGPSNISGASGKVELCKAVKVPLIAMDQMKFDQWLLRRCDAGKRSFNDMGLDLLDAHIIELKFSTREILSIDSLPSGITMSPIYRSPDRHILMDAEMNEMPMKIMFDTGTSFTLVNLAFAEAHPDAFEPIAAPGTRDVVRDADGVLIPVKYFLLRGLKVGDVDLGAQYVQALPLPPSQLQAFGPGVQAILGSSALQSADWVLDLKNDQWAAIPRPNPKSSSDK